ncbi:hypothetical protein [Comamonas thiooxydans]|uniref:hypothetical protein n=1 Tax=Comamonas thiooxydans TaxID=363952 RepID=UPI00311EE3B3
MLLASYKSTRPGLQGLFNRIIRLRLRGQYSHSEVVFEPGDGVGHLMPDGSAVPGQDGSLWCASSVAAEALPEFSQCRAGKTGGVRFKRVVLDPSRWDVVKVNLDPVATANWFKQHEGEMYDWQLILGFLSWVIPQKDQRWTCSEACAAALGSPAHDAWRFDPASLPAAAIVWA